MNILAIESSCDDTAAAVLTDDGLAANVVSSQLGHAEFGGVVPELASRAHQRLIVPVVQEALGRAGIQKSEVDAVAVTYGPGLAGSLLVGLSFGKALAVGLDVPLVGVNHLEGHVYSVFLSEPVPAFPYVCLTVSGGHTQLNVVREGFQHELLGRTRDDAAGEAFDKVAKMLDLGYPGGPVIDRLAREGNPAFHDFPRTKLGDFDFSFSGVKTSVLYYLNRLGTDEDRRAFLNDHLADVCAAFQQAVVDVLVDRVRKAVHDTGIKEVAIVGGVSANSALKREAREAAEADGFNLYIPPLAFSTDNAAMIAMTARFKLRVGQTSPLDLAAAPNLAL